MSSLGSTRVICSSISDINGAARDVQAAINAARKPAADRHAEPPQLPQGQPFRRADHDPDADLGHRSSDDFASTQLAQKISQTEGVGDVSRGRQFAAGGAGRAEPFGAVQSGRVAGYRTASHRQCQRAPPQGAVENPQQRWRDPCQRCAENRRCLPSADHSVQQRLGSAFSRRGRGQTRCKTCATPG